MSKILDMIKTTDIDLTALSESLCNSAEEEFTYLEPQHTPQELKDFMGAYIASCVNMALEKDVALAVEAVIASESWDFEKNEDDIRKFSEAYFEDVMNHVLVVNFSEVECANTFYRFIRDISVRVTISEDRLRVYIHNIPSYIAVCMLLHIPLSGAETELPQDE